MKVFVAGATGVLGRRVVRSLVTAGFETTGIGRTPGRRAELAEAGALAVELDLFDRGGDQRDRRSRCGVQPGHVHSHRQASDPP